MDFAKSVKSANGNVFSDDPHFSIAYTNNNVVSSIIIPVERGDKLDLSKGLTTNEVFAKSINQGFAVREPWLEPALTAVLSEEAKAKVYEKIQNVSHMSPDELIKINAAKEPSDLRIWLYQFEVDNKTVMLCNSIAYCYLGISSAEFEEMQRFNGKFFSGSTFAF